MDYSILAAELEQPQYAQLSDQQAADLLNGVTIPTRQRVTIERLQATAMEQSVYMALRTAIATPTTPPNVVALCQTVLDLVEARFADIDLDNPRSQMMFGALQQAGIMSAEQAAAIDALADGLTSRAAQLGLETVGDGHVRSAREMINGTA